MATIKAVIVPAKALAKGRHKIRISIAHNGTTRYIVTDITVDSEKEFKKGQIVKRPDAAYLNTKLRGIMQGYQKAIDELGYSAGLSCAELVYQIKHAEDNRHRTLQSIFEERMTLSDLKPTTKERYSNAWRYVKKYFNTSMLVENINHSSVLGFDAFLRKQRCLSISTVRTYMANFISVVNYARKCGYVQFKVSPFTGYTVPQGEVRDAWLTVDEVRAIRDVELKTKPMRFVRDLFMLSYYLGGMNLVDLLDYNFKENPNTIKYIRTKTEGHDKVNRYVEFAIPEEAKEIIKRITRADGRIDVTPSQYRMRLSRELYYRFNRIAEMLGIKYIIFYSARKSFSQHAFESGVPTSVIDYTLGHKLDRGGSSLYNYISVTPHMATDAVRKVIDNLNGKKNEDKS